MDDGARFTAVGKSAGHYESFYLKACRPGGGQGVWIRYTIHKRPGAPATGSLWLTLFDAAALGPMAMKGTVPATALSAPTGDWIRIGNGQLGPGRALGSIETDDHHARWDLRFSGDHRPCKYLPADWLYETRLPKTKFVAPLPDARFDGDVEVDGRTITLVAWPGMVGHNWGSEHAERWIWVEGAGFPGSDGDFLDLGAMRLRLGPFTSPWLASGMISVDGTRHRLGGLHGVRSSSIDESPSGCEFSLAGKDIVVSGSVRAAAKDFVGWLYADPAGPAHNVVNCSIADLELSVARKGRPAQRFALAGAAAYELGMRQTDHGIPIQPYQDG